MWLLDCFLIKLDYCDSFLDLSTRLFDISAIFESAFILVGPLCLEIDGLESIALKAGGAAADLVKMHSSRC